MLPTGASVSQWMRIASILSGVGAPNEKTVEWGAKVTLRGPNNNKGVDRIRVGFIQNLTPEAYRGEYGKISVVKVLINAYEGNTYLDCATGGPYSTFYCTPYIDGTQSWFSNPNAQNTSTNIFAYDWPVAGLPYYYSLKSSSQVPPPLPPQIMPNELQLLRTQVRWSFVDYVVATTTDAVGYTNFTVRAKAEWSFKACGGLTFGKTQWRADNNGAWLKAPTEQGSSWESVQGGEPKTVRQPPANNWIRGPLQWINAKKN
jgi:hypothetical protein